MSSLGTRKLVVRILLMLGGLITLFSMLSAVIVLRAEQATLLAEREARVRAVVPQLLSYPIDRQRALAEAAGFELVYPAPEAAAESRRLETQIAWYGSVPAHLYLSGREGGGWSVSIDLASERQIIDRSAQLFAFYLFLNAVVLLSVSGILLSRTVVRPLAVLAQTMERVRGQTASFRQLPVTRSDEIGSLFRSFNKLMGRVQEAEEKNLRYVEKLENAYQDLSTAQEQLIASEKLASLGRLSAGIAHEIGNPLSALSGYLSLAQKLSSAEDEERKEFVARSLREAERIDRIIRGLLDFARPRKDGQTVAKPVARLLDEIFETLRAQAMFQKIHWALDYQSVDGVVETASGRLEQVLFNLCINAADAMEGEGTLTLRAEQAAGRVRICVADTGAGIQPEDMPNLFEPFFTTKPSDRGTGLGLAISHQIVGALGGKIWCESAPGEGARFWVELPALPVPNL